MQCRSNLHMFSLATQKLTVSASKVEWRNLTGFTINSSPLPRLPLLLQNPTINPLLLTSSLSATSTFTFCSTKTPMSPPLLQIPKCVSLNPSFRKFLIRTNESAHRALARRQPWSELLDYEAFSRPRSLSEGTSRFRKNLSYFRINYLMLLGGVLAFSLFSHPLSLISLLLLISAWLFLYFFKPSDQPLIICSRTFSNNETLALLVAATFVILFFTSVGSLLISTALLGGAIICIHGAFRDPVNLFLDSQDEASSTGFFSISTEASIKSASAAVLDVAALV